MHSLPYTTENCYWRVENPRGGPVSIVFEALQTRLPDIVIVEEEFRKEGKRILERENERRKSSSWERVKVRE